MHYCQYKIIRIMPFIETGEFANIGVVLYCPKNGEMHYKLAPRRFGRVTQFFHDMDKDVYPFAIKTLENELSRLRLLMHEQKGSATGQQIFDDFTRQKGSILNFTDPRPRKTGDMEADVQALFNFYVHRRFVNKEYRETVLVKNLRQSLKRLNIDHYFKKKKLTDGLIEVPFPFVKVANDTPEGIIKPLAFDQKTASAMVEHADHWENRIKHLVTSETLHANDVLFAVEDPNVDDTRVLAYLNDFKTKLSDMGVEVADIEDQSRIIQFAQDRVDIDQAG